MLSQVLALVQAALQSLGGNYTAGSEAWNGIAVIPDATGESALDFPLEDAASRIWAAEVAALHGAAQQMQQQTRSAKSY